jgi:hypothetical protein
MPRSLLGVLVLLMALTLVLSGVAIAGIGEKGVADDDSRAFTTAEWRGSSTGFGMVVKSDSVAYTTTSTSWSDVPGMTVRYNVNPAAPKDQSVLITFSADTKCNQDPAVSVYCYLQVLVDGVPATPGAVAFNSVQHAANSTQTLAHGAHSMQWVAGPLGPGPHFITVQYRVDESNAEFEIWDHTLTVMGFYHNQVNVIVP